jgi:putative flippase GtrA
VKDIFKDPAIWRFLVSGLVATGVHFIILTLLIEMAHVRSAGIANGCAAVVGIATSYLGARFYVFGSDLPVVQTLPRFLVTTAAVACLHTLIVAVWTDVWRLPYVIGFLIATGASTVLNFLANRFIVFSGQPARSRK